MKKVVFCVKGVNSPLLANIYLHWFDKLFHRADGPARWANAKLVRYADDFVVMAKFQGKRLVDWIERQLEDWLGLKLNREKTRVVDLREERASLDFLGFTFQFHCDRLGRGRKYLNMTPSKKALTKEREKLRQMINRRWNFVPIRTMVEGLTRHLRGWKNYFKVGHSRKAFDQINSLVLRRMMGHLKRRSQRRYKLPKGETMYAHLKALGLEYL